jgi:hypothetical protein
VVTMRKKRTRASTTRKGTRWPEIIKRFRARDKVFYAQQKRSARIIRKLVAAYFKKLFADVELQRS